MRQVALIFALLIASVLQAMLPTTAWSGWAPAPLMSGLVLYYSLMHRRALVLEAALLAGLVEDSLSLMPLGTTSFGFAVAGLIIERYRDDVMEHQWTTHVAFGAMLNAGVTLFSMAMLLKDDLIHPPLFHMVLRVIGSFVLGGLVAPLVFALMNRFETTLGGVEAESS
ncbi:MAG: rod shape-determining protein MreD [Kiritimatiellae bacterium]|nr:rod shape-determining protein MreD [Kiritimatiellia bacterium]